MHNKANKDQNDWIVIGKFGRPHGIKGFISVYPFTDPPANVVHYLPWHVYLSNQWQPLQLLTIEEKKQHFIVQLEGYADRDHVAILTNANIGVARSHLPDLEIGEYYWHDLIGLTVSNLAGEELGIITELLSSGSNDILVIDGETQHLIPYSPSQYVIRVNLNEGTMIVDWDVNP